MAAPPIRTYPLTGTFMSAIMAKGIDLASILSSINISPEILKESTTTRVPEEQLTLILKKVFEETKEPSFALQLGRIVRPENVGVVGYAVMKSATYGEGLTRLSRYKKLFGEARLQLLPQEKGKEQWILRYELFSLDQFFVQFFVEAAFSNLIEFGRYLTKQPMIPVEVHFQFPAPDYLNEFQSIFQAPLLFDQPYNEIVFHEATLNLPMLSSDPTLCGLFEQHAEQLLAQYEGHQSIGEQVKHVLSEILKGDVPGVETVAQKLHMSTRSLQRKLKEEGIQYQEILLTIRKEFALSYLRDQKLEIGEVAFLLGFSHLSSFHRAFKKWTGMTPLEYRHSST